MYSKKIPAKYVQATIFSFKPVSGSKTFFLQLRILLHRILALSSHSVVRCPSVRPQASHPLLSPLYDLLDHTNHIFSESLCHPWSIHMPSLACKPNTNTQIHKYTNTQIHKYRFGQKCKQTQHVVYFWKGNGTRTSKINFPVVWHANANTQIHIYTNTQIQLRTKMQTNTTCAIFLKR